MGIAKEIISDKEKGAETGEDFSFLGNTPYESGRHIKKEAEKRIFTLLSLSIFAGKKITPTVYLSYKQAAQCP